MVAMVTSTTTLSVVRLLGGTKQTTVASILIQTTALATSALGTQPL
jgi:hypothetical protein